MDYKEEIRKLNDIINDNSRSDKERKRAWIEKKKLLDKEGW